MDSNIIRDRSDYLIVKKMINTSLEKEGKSGSIQIGKFYAKKYDVLIEKMLSSNKLDKSTLNEMLDSIDQDISDVRQDCSKRIPSNFTRENNEMISMIADFIKSI